MTRLAAPSSPSSTPAAAVARPVAVFAMYMSMPMCSSSALSQEESGHATGRRM
ncbi:MAG: hypothetical protein KJ062_03035 [Thermoanaerobaculia bacterium]|nr:hypothetical protein [Thermoanaerobaculia bacterium]